MIPRGRWKLWIGLLLLWTWACGGGSSSGGVRSNPVSKPNTLYSNDSGATFDAFGQKAASENYQLTVNEFGETELGSRSYSLQLP